MKNKTFSKFLFTDYKNILVILWVLGISLAGFTTDDLTLRYSWISFFLIVETIIVYKLYQKWKKLYKNEKSKY